MPLTRRGVVLAELLVALTLTALVAGMVLGSLVRLQRTAQTQVERAAARSALRTGVQLVRAELADLTGASPTDWLGVGTDQVTFRAQRAIALACGRSNAGVLIRESSLHMLRRPVPGRDSIDVLLPDSATGRRGWVRAGMTGPPGPGVCPDGAVALLLPLDLPLSASVPDGSPIRTWEVMEIRRYSSGGLWWLGIRSVSAGEAVQPVLGPVGSIEPVFHMLDGAGFPTTDPALGSRLVFRLVVRRDPLLALGGAARAALAGRESTGVVLHLPNGAAP